MTGEASYRDGRERPLLSPQPAAERRPQDLLRRRQPPSKEEQARRKAWGKVWGELNSRSAARLREDKTKSD